MAISETASKRVVKTSKTINSITESNKTKNRKGQVRGHHQKSSTIGDALVASDKKALNAVLDKIEVYKGIEKDNSPALKKAQKDIYSLLNKAGYNPSRVSVVLTFGIAASSPEVKRYLSSAKKVIESLPETSRIAKQYSKLGVTPSALTTAIKSTMTQKSKYTMSGQKTALQRKSSRKAINDFSENKQVVRKPKSTSVGHSRKPQMS